MSESASFLHDVRVTVVNLLEEENAPHIAQRLRRAAVVREQNFACLMQVVRSATQVALLRWMRRGLQASTGEAFVFEALNILTTMIIHCQARAEPHRDYLDRLKMELENVRWHAAALHEVNGALHEC